jgi:RecA/RadA recombinase
MIHVGQLPDPCFSPFASVAECQEFRRRVSERCAPAPNTALALLRATQETVGAHDDLSRIRIRYLPTGLLPLDDRLRGGIRVGTLTELVGKAGSGKTQFAMQTIVMAAAHRLGAIYIDTEQKLSLQRLREIAVERYPSNANASQQPEENLFSYNDNGRDASNRENGVVDPSREELSQQRNYANPETVLQNLTVHTPSSMDQLRGVLGTLEEEIFLRNQDVEKDSERHYPVRLVVLDSIAAPARRDFSAGSAPQRAASVMHCAQTLKRLADQFHLAILIINQVGGSWNNTNTNTTMEPSSVAPTRAALGTAWHHCVTTRIQLDCHDGGATEPEGVPGPSSSVPTRTAAVVKSNAVGKGEPIPFVVNNRGLAESPI